jgi:hypothetical protein
MVRVCFILMGRWTDIIMRKQEFRQCRSNKVFLATELKKMLMKLGLHPQTLADAYEVGLFHKQIFGRRVVDEFLLWS